MEGTQLLDRGFLFFNAADFCHARTLVEEAGKFIQLVRHPDGVDLNAAVILVADPTPQTDTVRVLLYEPTESDPLHSAGDEPAARLGRSPAQFCGSATPMDSNSVWTAERKDPIVNGFGRSLKPFSTT